jgi:hypothetical protein
VGYGFLSSARLCSTGANFARTLPMSTWKSVQAPPCLFESTRFLGSRRSACSSPAILNGFSPYQRPCANGDTGRGVCSLHGYKPRRRLQHALDHAFSMRVCRSDLVDWLATALRASRQSRLEIRGWTPSATPHADLPSGVMQGP